MKKRNVCFVCGRRFGLLFRLHSHMRLHDVTLGGNSGLQWLGENVIVLPQPAVLIKKTACVGKTEPSLRSVPSARLLSDEVDRWPRAGAMQESATYCVPPATKDRI